MLNASILIYFGFKIRKKFSTCLGVAFTYVSLSSLYICAGRWNQYQDLGGFDKVNIFYGVWYALTSFILLSLWFYLMEKKEFKRMELAFSFVYIVNSLIVIGMIYLPPGHRVGLLGYPGMNASFIAISLPLFLKSTENLKFKWVFMGIFVGVFAVLISNSSIPYGILWVLAVVYSMKSRKLLFAVGSLPILGYFILGDQFLNSAGRFLVYEKVFKWFHQSFLFNPMLGTGNGTFIALGPVAWGDRKDIMSWLHSDIGETYLTMGVVGIVILGYVFLKAIWIHKNQNIHYFAGLSAWMGCAVFNYPQHVAPTAILGMLYVVSAFKKDLWIKPSPLC